MRSEGTLLSRREQRKKGHVMADKQITTQRVNSRVSDSPAVRKLQRTLYQQAKKKPKWKAWSLYADLCRKEFIEEAMSRVLSNKGGSGIDGYTVQAMDAEWDVFKDSLQQELLAKTFRPSPVRRVSIPKDGGGTRKLGIPTVKDRVVQMILVLLLEPIFEADFHDESYAYRRGKRATEAVESISKALYFGKTMAIEADLSQYFDTIDHKRLMKLISGRVSDGAILALIKQFLKVPVIEENESGKKKTIANENRGVPQGGVISPLLANLYLDKLDKAVNGLDQNYVKMVRYADDFVILIKDGLENVMLERVKIWLEKAGLTLNMSKTKLTNTREKGKIEFLGFELSERISVRTGNRYIHSQPSKKSRLKFRDKIREELNHWTQWRDTDEMVRRVNRITRGWGNYFHYGTSVPVFSSTNNWLYQRVRVWLDKKHRGQGGGQSKYVRFPNGLITEKLGIYSLPNYGKGTDNAPLKG
jgi:RNA-directed DNA polymerase